VIDGLRFVEIARDVRAQLNQYARSAHTLRVARLAARLAFDHGEDAQRARLAGLLHDLARLYSMARLIADCESRHMPIDSFERANPIVLHSRLGAELAREEFGIDDEAVLSAIRKHTLADARMSRLDTILYLADALEAGRDYPERTEILALARRDLDGALRRVLESSIAYQRAKDADVAPQTFAALRALDATRRNALPDLIDLVRAAAEEKKADDITVIDLDGRTIVADAFVIATGRSKIQTRSIADAIAQNVRAAGLPVARTEGYNDGEWILIDLGTVVVHVFTPEQRAFYNLERLWGKTSEARVQSS
jgi:ribosome silencing factor RsfS/YbeB/iojap